MVCISSLLFSCSQRPHRADQCGIPECCYDHVIHVTHHKVPVFLRHSGQSLSHQFLKKKAVALHKPKGILFHWHNPNSNANPVFSLSFFRRGTCQKAEPKSSVMKDLASPSFERLSSIRDIGYASFIVTAFK